MFALAAAAEIALLWALSSTPGETLAPALPGPSGNLLHVVAYGVLCGLLIRAWVPLGSSWTDPAAWYAFAAKKADRSVVTSGYSRYGGDSSHGEIERDK